MKKKDRDQDSFDGPEIQGSMNQEAPFSPESGHATGSSPTEEKDNQSIQEEAIKEWQDKYLRLSAEFDNYRKRTLKEKMELIKHAGEDLIVRLLPVVDDFERALQAVHQTGDLDAMKEGLELIYKKFGEFIQTQGVKPIDALHQDFDTDRHEALTQIPAPSDEMKGKVLEVIQKGYTLNDKVIRFAKVVIGD
jgi:molecular chaperone GrpE